MIPALLLATAAALAPANTLDSARQAIADGLPQVAVFALQNPEPESAAHAALLGRALVEAGRPTEAAKALEPWIDQSAEARFWFAQSLAAGNAPQDALSHYLAAAGDKEIGRESLLGAARMQARLGDLPGAIARLAEVESWPSGSLRNRALAERAALELESGDARSATRSLDAIRDASATESMRVRFLRAKAAAANGSPAEAAELFARVEPLDPTMAVDTVVERAGALLQLGAVSEAENLLEEFIGTHETFPDIGRAFDALSRVYAANPSPSTADLRRWTDAPEPSPRRSYALFHRAKWEAAQNREDLAQRLLGILIRTDPNHPLAPAAALNLASSRIASGEFEGALEVLPEPGTEPAADFLRGLALAALGQTALATAAFESASTDPSLAEPALYNAALCAIRSGEPDHPAVTELRRRFPDSPRLAQLRFHEALDLAETDPVQAAERLSVLVDESPPREASLAAMALAEIQFQSGDRPAARVSLQRVSTNDAQKAALAVFLADTGDPAGTDAALAAAARYVKDFPGSPAEPDVRMKWAEILFRKGDFAAARLQFETLARQSAGTPLEQTALFLAAQSAARLLAPEALDGALLLFEEVAALNGSLASRARLEQAILQSARGRTNEAVVIFDRVAASADTPDVRFAALIEKGKALYLSGDPKSVEDAIGAWRSITADPEATPDWRNQAWSRIATANEKLGRTDAALAACYEVIRPGRDENPGFLWFYKAGFDAGRLLESAERWEEAIRVYEMIAAVDGPRAAEAKSRINKIRLENFLWDGN